MVFADAASDVGYVLIMRHLYSNKDSDRLYGLFS